MKKSNSSPSHRNGGFTSSVGFIIACVGSAVGLGNKMCIRDRFHAARPLPLSLSSIYISQEETLMKICAPRRLFGGFAAIAFLGLILALSLIHI